MVLFSCQASHERAKLTARFFIMPPRRSGCRLHTQPSCRKYSETALARSSCYPATKLALPEGLTSYLAASVTSSLTQSKSRRTVTRCLLHYRAIGQAACTANRTVTAMQHCPCFRRAAFRSLPDHRLWKLRHSAIVPSGRSGFPGVDSRRLIILRDPPD